MLDSKTPRRRSLLKGAALAAGAISAPMVATAQTTTTLRFQSTWPAKDIFHEYANDFANKVNLMASGKLKIEVLPSGSVVPAFQLLEAVNKGTLDGGHGVVAYHYGKNSALAACTLKSTIAFSSAGNALNLALLNKISNCSPDW